MLRKRAPFTESENAKLINLYRLQSSYPEMCEQLKRTEGSIKNRLSYLRRSGEIEDKPKGRKLVWTDELKAKLTELHYAGFSREEIGKKLGKNRACIQEQAKKMRLVKPRCEYDRVKNFSHKNSKPQPDEQPKREAVLVSPVHYLNVKAGQCRHFVNREFMCGKPSKSERCAEHRA